MSEAINPLFSLKDKVCVVLGGTSGIGQAIARGFAKAGGSVIASSRDQERVDAMAREFELAGTRTLSVTSDVQDRDSLERLCSTTKRVFGKVDVLVVTSGVLKKGPTAEMAEEDWLRVIDINLNGTFRANQVFGRQMIEQQSGSIINIGSLTSFVSFNEVAAYCASKGGVLMLTKELACEWAKHNIRVNAIAPGVFRTPLNSHVIDLPERQAAILPRTPMGRYGHVDELVGLAIYLACSASSFTTGQVIAVDGGFLAKGV